VPLREAEPLERARALLQDRDRRRGLAPLHQRVAGERRGVDAAHGVGRELARLLACLDGGLQLTAHRVRPSRDEERVALHPWVRDGLADGAGPGRRAQHVVETADGQVVRGDVEVRHAEPPVLAGLLQEREGLPAVLDPLGGPARPVALEREQAMGLAEGGVVARAPGMRDGAVGVVRGDRLLAEAAVHVGQPEVVPPGEVRVVEPGHAVLVPQEHLHALLEAPQEVERSLMPTTSALHRVPRVTAPGGVARAYHAGDARSADHLPGRSR
jgi:hypothetical protein